MPLYEYACESCGKQFERIRKFSDPPLETCPLCNGGPVHKLVSSPAIQFKGSGFYITDYGRKGSDSSTGGESKSGGEAKSGDTKSGAETKSASESKSGTESKTSSESKSGGESKSDGASKPAGESKPTKAAKD